MSENKKLLVVIDPGHTGNTYNAGAVKGYYESKAVYDLSLYEKTALEKRGIDVILTRERNQDPGLYERGQMAVKKGNGYANVLFESNHTDAFNGKACGVTVVRSAHLPGSEKLAEKIRLLSQVDIAWMSEKALQYSDQCFSKKTLMDFIEQFFV